MTYMQHQEQPEGIEYSDVSHILVMVMEYRCSASRHMAHHHYTLIT